jgi:hypothetical protein
MGEARKILKIATDLHSNYTYSKKLKHFYYFFDGNAIYIFF